MDLGRTVVNTVGAAYLLPKRLRVVLLRASGMRIGRALIFSGSLFRTTEVEIGDGTFVNHRCLFDGPVVLGRNVAVSTSVTFAGGGHDLGPSSGRAGAARQSRIVVGDGVWIGANAVILGGVTIAPGCVIGAGAVVTRSTEPDGVYAGVPARRIRTLVDDAAALLPA
jgi:maltose O-acetyltransferase